MASTVHGASHVICHEGGTGSSWEVGLLWTPDAIHRLGGPRVNLLTAPQAYGVP